MKMICRIVCLPLSTMLILNLIMMFSTSSSLESTKIRLDTQNPELAVRLNPSSGGETYLEFSPFELAIGKKFNVTVYINDLDGTWNLTAATFCLCYNTTLINMTQYWPNFLFTGPNTVTYDGSGTWDEIHVTVANPVPPNPSGDVTLIVMEFEVKFQDGTPPRPLGDYDETPIFFCDYELKDHNDTIPTDPPIEGRVRIYCIIGGSPHDIAITNVTLSKTVLPQGYSVNVTITVKNEGLFTENFNVTAYTNTTTIETKTNITLTSQNSTTLTFTWNTTNFAKGNYTISANATTVPGDTYIQNNNYIDGIVIVTILGDGNGDRICDMKDIIQMIIRYGSRIGESRYSANFDITCDGIIDMKDIVIAILNYGQRW